MEQTLLDLSDAGQEINSAFLAPCSLSVPSGYFQKSLRGVGVEWFERRKERGGR